MHTHAYTRTHTLPYCLQTLMWTREAHTFSVLKGQKLKTVSQPAAEACASDLRSAPGRLYHKVAQLSCFGAIVTQQSLS